jgi:hypothetical protein
MTVTSLALFVLILLLTLGWWGIWSAPALLLAIVGTVFCVFWVLERSGRFSYNLGGPRT